MGAIRPQTPNLPDSHISDVPTEGVWGQEQWVRAKTREFFPRRAHCDQVKTSSKGAYPPSSWLHDRAEPCKLFPGMGSRERSDCNRSSVGGKMQ